MKARIPPRPLDRGSLWLLTIAPTIWGAHLLLSYITGAVWCAKSADPLGTLGGVRTAIVWYTSVALAGIIVVGIEGFRRHRFGTETTTHDLDSPEDRHRFLGFATLLLAGLSAVAVLYAAIAVVFFETCR
jgi:hypothetical protein